MAIADDCILGNGALHERFLLATEILTALVSSAPHALSIEQLETDTGRPSLALRKLCVDLSRTRVIREPENLPGHWTLACEPGSVTLADVFRCVIDRQAKRRPLPAARIRNPERRYHDVNLLVMQATIAINQSVFQHLRQFPLERLKINIAGAGLGIPHPAPEEFEPDDSALMDMS